MLTPRDAARGNVSPTPPAGRTLLPCLSGGLSCSLGTPNSQWLEEKATAGTLRAGARRCGRGRREPPRVRSGRPPLPPRPAPGYSRSTLASNLGGAARLAARGALLLSWSRGMVLGVWGPWLRPPARAGSRPPPGGGPAVHVGPQEVQSRPPKVPALFQWPNFTPASLKWI